MKSLHMPRACGAISLTAAIILFTATFSLFIVKSQTAPTNDQTLSTLTFNPIAVDNIIDNIEDDNAADITGTGPFNLKTLTLSIADTVSTVLTPPATLKTVITGSAGINNDTEGITLSNHDHFGSSLALDGTRLIVGAYGDDTGGTARGAVYILEDKNNDGDYEDTIDDVKENIKISSDTDGITLDNYDQFGWSVATDGTRLIVGAPSDDDGYTDSGAVYILEDKNNDGDYEDTIDGAKEKIKISHNTAGITLKTYDGFGWSVAADGARLIVGAIGDDTGGTERGAVYILEDKNNDGDYEDTVDGIKENIKISSNTDGITLVNQDYFGVSVAIDGNRYIIGADGDNTGGVRRGAVYILEDKNNDGDYEDTIDDVKENIKISSDTDGITLSNLDYFGSSVAIEGDYLIVGSYRQDANDNKGTVHILKDRNNDGDYADPDENVEINSSTDAVNIDTDNNEQFGNANAVAVDGNRIAVGVPSLNTANESNGMGAVRVLELQTTFTSTLTSAQIQSLTPGIITITAESEDFSDNTNTQTHTFAYNDKYYTISVESLQDTVHETDDYARFRVWVSPVPPEPTGSMRRNTISFKYRTDVNTELPVSQQASAYCADYCGKSGCSYLDYYNPERIIDIQLRGDRGSQPVNDGIEEETEHFYLEIFNVFRVEEGENSFKVIEDVGIGFSQADVAILDVPSEPQQSP